jgi:hypothetical protein
VERDLNTAWTAIEAAMVDSAPRPTTPRLAALDKLLHYCRGWNCDPWLVDTNPHQKTQRLLAFAARVQTGIFGKDKQVGFQYVEKALRYVAQTLVLTGYDDPRRDLGAKYLNLPFCHLLKSYRTSDPAPWRQLALPVATVEGASAYHQDPDQRTRATANLMSR